MRVTFLVFASAVLFGCTSFGVLDAELPKYNGKQLDQLVAKLGYPTSQQTLMGRTVYVWSTNEQFTSFQPTTTTGYVGTTPVMMTGNQATVSNLSCTIRVFTDSNNIIQGYDYNGNNGTCFTYSNRLKE